MRNLQKTEALLPEEPAGIPRRKFSGRLIGSLPAKVAAFLLLLILSCLTAVCALGAFFIYQEGLYTISQESYQQRAFDNIAYGDQRTVLELVLNGYQGEAEAYCERRNIASASVETAEGETVWSWRSGEEENPAWQFFGVFDGDTIQMRLNQDLPREDAYALANRVIRLGYALRYWIYAIMAAAAVCGVVCFVFLLEASGHHPGEEGVRPGWGTGLPLDVLTVGGGMALFLIEQLLVEEVLYGISSDVVTIVGLGVCMILALAAVTGYCMSLALRIKLGQWWKNTVIFWALGILWRILKRVGAALAALGRGMQALFRQFPLIWKTAVLFGALCLLELMALLLCWWEMDNFALFWFFEKLLLFPVVLSGALMLRKLQKGGQALAAGDLSYQVDTRHMIWDLRRHGEDLNSIAAGMNRAVDQRMKSERMKTELITNVSHDIKTPLTSIINYADLIGKEPAGSEKIPEYAGVLLRQSERLKKLIEDLVEASKASTGNLEVVLAPCEVGVLLTQAAGEYQQRLSQADLTLVTRQPEHPVTILADGRRLWRIFDNLMNNICKYAQAGTRVYLTLEEQTGMAVISFKNTSRSPLDISAEDLIERFVRGDASRNTEGSGLGLSIAKSLTDLQKGTMELTVDGDLFKVVLRFPLAG